MVLSLLFLQEQVPECPLTKVEDTMDDATATAPTVRLTTATDTADGIMAMTMYTAANLAGIKAVAAETKENGYVWEKEKGFRACI